MAKLIPHEKFDRIVALQGEGHRTPRELVEGTGVFIWVVTSIAKGNHYYQRREKKPLTGRRAPGIKTGAHVPYLPTPEEIAELCA